MTARDSVSTAATHCAGGRDGGEHVEGDLEAVGERGAAERGRAGVRVDVAAS